MRLTGGEAGEGARIVKMLAFSFFRFDTNRGNGRLVVFDVKKHQ